MKVTKRKITLAACSIALALLAGCDSSSDREQQEQQERILKEGSSQTGMPAIVNFRERKLVKMLLEKRDQENLITYTYIYAENSGSLKFFCKSVGFAIPYATQYTNPQKYIYQGSGVVLPQADPNGLFSPQSAEASWVMCRSDKGKVEPVYVEPKVVVSPFPLTPG